MDDRKNEREIIPERDFREAIRACRKDPELDRYFKLAPPAARRFIGLGFYSTYFGERADKQKYADYLAQIEPTLSETDLRYLIRFETDKGTRQYLRDLLAHPKPQPTPKPPKSEPKPSEPKKPKEKPAAAWLRKSLSKLSEAEDVPGNAFGAWRLALQVAGGLAIVLLLCWGVKLSHDLSGRDRQIRDLQEELRSLRDRIDRAASASKKPPVAAPEPTPRQPLAPEPELDPAAEEPQTAAVQTESEEIEERPVATNAVVAGTGQKAVGKRRVRLTDGVRIVRHPDGTTEVPRTFSAAGAGLRNPFWVYDEKLAKAGKTELEAARVRKARAEWKALYDEAMLGER